MGLLSYMILDTYVPFTLENCSLCSWEDFLDIFLSCPELMNSFSYHFLGLKKCLFIQSFLFIIQVSRCFPCVLSSWHGHSEWRFSSYSFQDFLCVEYLSTHSRFSMDSRCPLDISTYMLNVTSPHLICCPSPKQRALCL